LGYPEEVVFGIGRRRFMEGAIKGIIDYYILYIYIYIYIYIYAFETEVTTTNCDGQYGYAALSNGVKSG
jgi:hypothetical protein